MTQTHEPLILQAPVGLTAEEEQNQLKAQFPDVVKGTSQEVPAELRDAYRYALMAEEYWKNQKTLALNQMRRLIGTAQTATVDGVPVASRRVFKRSEYVVPETEIDAFWPANAKTS